jgi:hypothetical protein
MSDDAMEKTKALMQSLVRMKPKPHGDMKLGKKQPIRKAKRKNRK